MIVMFHLLKYFQLFNQLIFIILEIIQEIIKIILKNDNKLQLPQYFYAFIHPII